MSHPPASHHTLGFTSSLVQLAHIFEAEASFTRLSDQATHKAPSSPCSTPVRHPPLTGLPAHQIGAHREGFYSIVPVISQAYQALPPAHLAFHLLFNFIFRPHFFALSILFSRTLHHLLSHVRFNAYAFPRRAHSSYL